MRFSSRTYVLGLIAITVAVLALAEVGLRLWVAPIKYTPANRTWLIYNATGNDVAVGDSHIASTFVAEPSFVNLGVGGAATGDMARTLEEYYRHRKPGRAIVLANAQLFSRPLKRADYSKFYRQNVGLPFQIYVFEPGIAAEVMKLRDIPALIAARKRAEQEAFTTGKWHLVAKDKRLALTRKRLARQRPRVPGREQIIATYRNMIAHLKTIGVRVCMLKTPLTPEYLAMAEQDQQFRWAWDFFRRTAAQFAVTYVDANALDVSYTNDLFFNMDHLAANGARKVAPKIIHACFGGK